MKSNYIIFSKYSGSIIGGAEISLNKLEDSNFFSEKKFHYTYFDSIYTKNSKKHVTNRVKYRISTKLFDFKRFKYLEYVLNRKKLKTILNELEYENIIVYGYWSAALQTNKYKSSILLIRSTQGIGRSKNIYSGIKRILYYAYRVIEFPFWIVWKYDYKKSIKNYNQIIANSNFTNELFYKLWKVTPTSILLPSVSKRTSLVKKNFILFVGDSEIKGLSTFLYLAKNLPDINFIIYSRNKIKTTLNNVIEKRWSNEFINDLLSSKLLIVPSMWEEAYGRVAREKFLSGGNLIVSGIGGLPETVDFEDKYINYNYRNKKIWLKKVKNMM